MTHLKLRKITTSDYDLYPGTSPFAMIDDGGENLFVIEGRTMELLTPDGKSVIYDLNYSEPNKIEAEYRNETVQFTYEVA